MGTVKVYDGVVGKRLREAASIAETTQGEVLGCLVVLWQWAMDNADENGVVKHAGRKDVIRCVSAVSDDLFTEIADALFQAGFVAERDGCLVFDEWGTQQAWHYKEETARKRDMERKRNERQKAKNAPAEASKPKVTPLESKAQSTSEVPLKPEQSAEPKKKASKKHYAEFVLMTKEEYDKLCAKYGEPLVEKAIEILNQYIGSSGRSYKSHYMTILGWPMKEACKRNPLLFSQFKASQAQSGADDNPYAEYMEE